VAGRFEQALSMVEEGLGHGERTQWRFAEPDLLRQKGELLLRQGDPARVKEAEDCLRRAVQRTRELGLHQLELRAAMSLSSAWVAQGRHGEALELLEPAYGGLPEVDEARELHEARVLLEELRAAHGGTVVRAR
jgi:non-specific serine/threonine protein kinase